MNFAKNLFKICHGISRDALRPQKPQKVINYLLVFLFMLVSYATAASPMEFEIYLGAPGCPGCVIVKADGDITESTSALFEAYIQENSAAFDRDTTVVMNSLGGSLMSGLKMGEIIRAKGFSTHIARIEAAQNGGYILADGSCASACAYAYLGGLRRSMEIQSEFGLHQISVRSDVAVSLSRAVRTTQDIIADISNYVEKMGASTEIVTIATRTSDSSIQWVSESDQSTLGIVNSNGLIQQRPWQRPSGTTSWSTWTVLPDGSRDLLLLSCDQYPYRSKAGHVRLSLQQSKELPNNHPYSQGYANLPVHIDLDGIQINDKSEQMFFFSGPGHSMSGLEIPISPIRLALRINRPLTIKISYSSDFPENFSTLDHPIPLEGLGQALDSLTQYCSHLAN